MGTNLESLRENLSQHKFRMVRLKTLKYNKINVNHANVEFVLKFDDEMANYMRPKTRMCYLSALIFLLIQLKDKKLKEVKKEDMIKVFELLRSRNNKETTIQSYGFRYLRFFQWLYGMKKHSYPDCIDWFHPKRNGNIKLRNDIPTMEEIKQLVKVANNVRDKAILMVLYESAARCHEFLKMKRSDIEFTSYGAKLTVHSDKTDDRIVYLVDSIPYLKDWLNHHPFKDQQDFDMWVDCLYRARKWNYGKPLTHNAISWLMRNLSRKAGFQKGKFSPHALRHRRLTEISKDVTEMTLRKIAGWKENSTMPQVYLHYNDKLVEDQMLSKVYHITNGEKVEDRITKPVECFSCKTPNPEYNKYCLRCGSPLDNDIGLIKKAIQEEINKILNERLQTLNQLKS
jgi:integrase